MSLPRPQPLGVLPLPAGWLVVPERALTGADPAGVQRAVERLLTGMLPLEWPVDLRAHQLAAGGDIAAAAAAIDPVVSAADAYNHFVLSGEATSLTLARSGAELDQDGDLAAVVEVAAYTLGHPAVLPDVEDTKLDLEVAAHVHAARAASCLEARDAQGALDALVAAESAAREVSPVLAAQLLGQQASLLQEVNGADDDVVAAYRESTDALRGLDAVEPAAAELILGMATAYQELASVGGPLSGQMLGEAVRAYHLALRMLRMAEYPERYAFAHSNLALAYLAMPMVDARDKLRRGIAVQSLREALKVYTREQHPREWAAVTLNLANALQHLPTTHPVENLIEAVGMYDELLVARPEDLDPLGHARVLANQGTALSHLGIHDQARLKLEAARTIFSAHGDIGSAATVTQALTEIDDVTGDGPPGPRIGG